MATLHLTRRQARAVDELAIDRYGFLGMVLMENAGRGVVDVLLGIDSGLAEEQARSVVILCGKGNNAGDGFVIARHLEIRGIRSQVVLLAPPHELRGDARANYEILGHTDVPMIDLSAVDALPIALASETADCVWIVDALLGTGASGEPREPLATAISWMNAQPVPRLAIDVPSGLDCDTGQAAAATVIADHTCTLVAPKVGFLTPAAADFLGQLHVVSIGIPQQLIDEVASSS
jgi:NAD(P)H-hydrate epimerase